ncbi:hypothetical protein EI94DRAFT_759998 [Lactarius quietus]|nr:hypothetical protein EI94DRAFT_759998 [Lactarius quietus]
MPFPIPRLSPDVVLGGLDLMPDVRHQIFNVNTIQFVLPLIFRPSSSTPVPLSFLFEIRCDVTVYRVMSMVARSINQSYLLESDFEIANLLRFRRKWAGFGFSTGGGVAGRSTIRPKRGFRASYPKVVSLLFQEAMPICFNRYLSCYSPFSAPQTIVDLYLVEVTLR